MRSAVLVLATVVAGVQAGTYGIFGWGVMPGLALGDDRTYVAALQQFNVSFVNPWFLGCFLGAPLLALVALVAHRGARPAVAACVAGGFVLGATAVVITVVVHLPLNDALDAAGPPERVPDPGAVRAAHEQAWVSWNVVRAVTSTGSLVALACALLVSAPVTRSTSPEQLRAGQPQLDVVRDGGAVVVGRGGRAARAGPRRYSRRGRVPPVTFRARRPVDPRGAPT